MKVKTYWCNINNFGDSLNTLIYKKFLGIKIKYQDIQKAELIGIGSLLDNCLMDKNGFYEENYPLIIFSTGFGFEEGGFFHNKSIIIPEKLNRKIQPFAVRGYLTLERIKKLTNSSCENVIVGDGGLLSNYFVKKETIKQKYNLGIIPHYADFNNPIFEKIKNSIPNSVIIDITQNPIKFLEKLCECKAIISTAMHGLIACDSLNIPNMWVRISEETTSRYKFHDYYSVLNTDKQPFNILENYFDQDTLDLLIKNYDINYKVVQKIQKDLINSLKLIKKQLLKNKIKSFFNLFIRQS